jgi:hemoglobin
VIIFQAYRPAHSKILDADRRYCRAATATDAACPASRRREQRPFAFAGRAQCEPQGASADRLHAFVRKSLKPDLRQPVPPPLAREHAMSTEVVDMKVRIAAGVAAILLLSSAAPATMHNGSLYSRLGGKPAIRLVVEDFVQNVAEDRRINGFFGTTNIPRLKRLLVEQICQASGGPCQYSGRSMKAAHRGLGIRNADFNALVQDLGKSLNKYGVPAREQRELTAILLPLKRDIVSR